MNAFQRFLAVNRIIIVTSAFSFLLGPFCLVAGKINLHEFLEKKSLMEMDKLLSHFQKSPTRNLLQPNLIKLFSRFDKDTHKTKEIAVMAKIIYALRCCANKATLEIYQEVLEDSPHFILKQQVLESIAIFPQEKYLPLIKESYLKAKEEHLKDEFFHFFARRQLDSFQKDMCNHFLSHGKMETLKSLSLLKNKKTYHCLSEFINQAKFQQLKSLPANLILTLSISLSELEKLQSLFPKEKISFARLFFFLLSKDPLLKQNSLTLIKATMNHHPQVFLETLKKNPFPSQFKFYELMGKSSHKEWISYLADQACCSPSLVVKTKAREALQIKMKNGG